MAEPWRADTTDLLSTGHMAVTWSSSASNRTNTAGDLAVAGSSNSTYLLSSGDLAVARLPVTSDCAWRAAAWVLGRGTTSCPDSADLLPTCGAGLSIAPDRDTAGSRRATAGW